LQKFELISVKQGYRELFQHATTSAALSRSRARPRAHRGGPATSGPCAVPHTTRVNPGTATRRALTRLSAVHRVTRQGARCLSLSCTPVEVPPHALRGSTGPHLAALPYHRSYASLACLIRGRRFLPGAHRCGSLAAVAELRPKPLPYLLSSPPLPCYHTRAPQRTSTQPAPLHSPEQSLQWRRPPGAAAHPRRQPLYPNQACKSVAGEVARLPTLFPGQPRR
jgi:hypothetical protein